ncbi:hypothetical protein GCM10011415_15520 [Salipiger pallidus]|uniref:Uncharacterized protein n=1 Tax=Salipiger pallidus TaxID=1775170 RepID=A0A8J2ZIL4_9RHOB|nr:hypothetical protein GCM10011415_15520 [Salipiger pallidus]
MFWTFRLRGQASDMKVGLSRNPTLRNEKAPTLSRRGLLNVECLARATLGDGDSLKTLVAHPCSAKHFRPKCQAFLTQHTPLSDEPIGVSVTHACSPIYIVNEDGPETG